MAERVILCVTRDGCTCGAPASTPTGMHHCDCAIHPGWCGSPICRPCQENGKVREVTPFVAPAEIIQRVKAIRGKRIAEYGPLDPPDDCEDYHAWLYETRKAIADGTLKPTPRREIDKAEQQRVEMAIEGTFRGVPE